ncbi:hypothetical protein LY78DRAFT_264497 [Colletotrichum sublineola]|nr:hypothetical protein LY78DRAFT_264497 [Colletotrichum sublineola]
MRRGGIEPPAPRRCWMATENFTTKPSALRHNIICCGESGESKQEEPIQWENHCDIGLCNAVTILLLGAQPSYFARYNNPQSARDQRSGMEEMAGQRGRKQRSVGT